MVVRDPKWATATATANTANTTFTKDQTIRQAQLR